MSEKIYIVSWNGVSDAGGVERVTQYLLKAWQDSYDVEVIDYPKMERNIITKKLLRKHYVIDAIIASLYARRLKKQNPNCKIVIQGFNCPFIKADIAIAHGSMRGYKLALTNDIKWHFNQIFEKIGMNRADRVIAVSGNVKNEIVELYGVDTSKISIVENGVDTDIFFPTNREDDGICRVLYAGRLEEGKGLKQILGLAQYIENMDKYRMIIATNNSENTQLFKNLTKTKIIIGLNVNEMNSFYNSGNVFFFPSLYEGFGLVTLEALAAGIPVIGRDLGAVGDLYAKKFEGVKLLGMTDEENLSIISQLYSKFIGLESRSLLHNNVEKNFSIGNYNEKLKRIWK